MMGQTRCGSAQLITNMIEGQLGLQRVPAKSMFNLSIAWVIIALWARSGLAEFDLSPIRTIIRRVMYTASPGILK